MTISRRNIFFTLLLNLVVIISMMFNGIFTAIVMQGHGSWVIPITASFFIPLGASVLFSTHGFLKSITSIVIDFLIVLLLFRSFPFTNEIFVPITVISFLFTVVTGAIIGTIIQRNVSLGKGYFFIITSYIVIIFSTTLALAYFIEHKDISGFFYDGYESLRKTYDSIYTPDLRREYKLQELFNADDMIRFIPSMIAETVFFISFIYYFITKKILESIKYKVSKIKEFKNFYISNLLGALVILVICVGLILRNYGHVEGDIIATTGFTVIKLLLTVTGAAFIYDKFISVFKMKKVTTIIIIVGAVYILPVVVYTVGFIEMIFDFRRLDPQGIFKRKRG